MFNVVVAVVVKVLYNNISVHTQDVRAQVSSSQILILYLLYLYDCRSFDVGAVEVKVFVESGKFFEQ